VYKNKNVILSNGNRISQNTSWLRNRVTELLKNTEKMVIVGDLINKYTRLNKQTGAYLEKLKANLPWSAEETLGIFVLGSVYYNSIQFPKNKVINFDILVKIIKDFLKKKSFKQIYICTEDFRVYLKLYEILKTSIFLRALDLNLV
jgi:menaquinone-dependent protoporphyrinogen IX oxidase